MDSREPSVGQLRRVALVRRLYEIGLGISRSGGPGAGFSLLCFHDALEMLLQLLCERYEVTEKTKEFGDYWAALERKGLTLSGRADIVRLNVARVNLKHKGLLPAAFELEGFRAATTNVLEEGCAAAFGRPLSTISLVALVPDSAGREALERAEVSLEAGDHGTALSEVAVTFVLLLRHHQQSSAELGSQRDYSLSRAAISGFGWSDAHSLADHFPGFDRYKAKSAFDAIYNSADVFSEAITVVGYGLNFPSYLRFKSHMPVVRQIIGGNPTIDWMRKPSGDPNVVRECINFVVDASLRLSGQ